MIKEYFKGLSNVQRTSYALLAMIGLFLVGLFVVGRIHRYQLSNRGVYYIAKIIEITSSKSGPNYTIEYEFGGEFYTGNFKPGFDFEPNRVGAYVFIRLLPENPGIHQFLTIGEVPECVRTFSFSRIGWTKIPECE